MPHIGRNGYSSFLFFLSIASSVLIGGYAEADPITGTPSVIDGDTLEIRGTRIRLHGIDAPESNQRCTNSGGESWPCGQRASLALADYIGRSTLTCWSRDTDRYGRVVAECFKGKHNANAWMVAEGWAVAYRRYSRDYDQLEDAAKVSKKNIWEGPFVMPWEWRRGRRDAPR